jgi:hypothetical protein
MVSALFIEQLRNICKKKKRTYERQGQSGMQNHKESFAVAYLNLLPHNLSEETDKNYRELWSA